MDPYEFLFLILPLATLVGLLVFVVYKLAKRDETMRQSELKTLNELMQMGAVDKDSFSFALQALLNDKVIDVYSFERLGKLIESSFDETVEPVTKKETV